MKRHNLDRSQVLMQFVDSCFRYRYFLLCLILLGRYLLFSTLGVWTEDFWEHSAAVREIMTHPFSPRHPQLLVNVSHAFFTPYSALVAVFALSAHLDPINALAIFGAINLCLLTYGLFMFVRTISDKHSSHIAFYSILFCLFLWGSSPWSYSGFYSIQAINSVLPYPSTCALGLSLWVLSYHYRLLHKPALVGYVLVVCTSSGILVTHALTAIFLFSGLFAQAVAISKPTMTRLMTVIAVMTSAILLGLCWPYFSMLQLLTREGETYRYSNGVMYFDVVARIWPTLFCLPLILRETLRLSNRILSLILIAMIVSYVFGYVTENYSYGRTISFALLMANIILATVMVKIEGSYFLDQQTKLIKLTWLMVGTWLVIGWVSVSFTHLLSVANSIYLGRTISSKITYRDLQFIGDYTNQYDLILSDIESSWIIPTLGGKVIGTDHPLAFVPDWYQRRIELLQFFSIDKNYEYRKKIVDKYRPKFILVKQSSGVLAEKIIDEFSDKSKYTKVYEDNKYLLLEVNELHKS